MVRRTLTLLALCYVPYVTATSLEQSYRSLFASKKAPTLEELKLKFPSIKPEVVERFYNDNPSHASSKLTSYLEWQNGHTVGDVKTDVERWNLAVQQAFEYVAKRKPGKLRGTELDHAPEDEVLYDTELMDHHGHPVLVFFPCLLDLSIAGAVPLYSDIATTYLEEFFLGLEPGEKFTLLMDIRPGRGWHNPSQKQLMSAVKKIAGDIQDLEPGRINEILVYPVPTYGVTVWNMISPFLDKHTHDEVHLIAGSSVKLHSPVPVGALGKYIDRNVVEAAEHKRHSLFNPQDPHDVLEGLEAPNPKGDVATDLNSPTAATDTDKH